MQIRVLDIVFLVALAAALLAVDARAQRTWIVDANKGPGWSFASLQTAMMQVPAGDTLVVRKGVYPVDVRAKSLAILGQPGAVIASSSSMNEIHGLPANGSLVISGMTFESIRFRNNGGRIHLNDCSIDARNRPLDEIVDCRLVTLTNCRMWSLLCWRSRLIVTASSFRNHDLNHGTEALTLRSCTTDFAQSAAFGGDCRGPAGDDTPAIGLYGGSLTIAGDKTTIRGGQPDVSSCNRATVPAIRTTTGVIRLDPRAAVAAGGGGPAITGGATVTRRVTAAVTASATGSVFVVDVYATAGTTIAVAVSDPMAAPVVLPWGEQWLRPTAFLLLYIGSVPSTNHRVLRIGPVAGVAPGTAVMLQALTANPLALSVPSVLVR